VKRYELTPLARFDMREIWAYAAEQWGRRVADRYIRELTETLEALAMDPHLGVLWEALGCRKRLFRSHIVFYTLSTDGIIVIRILHQQMDATTRLG
jgi:toxin ParE1/3/4